MDAEIHDQQEMGNCETPENYDFSEEVRYWKIWVLVIVGTWYFVGFSECFGSGFKNYNEPLHF